jgi:hypothetical protein
MSLCPHCSECHAESAEKKAEKNMNITFIISIIIKIVLKLFDQKKLIQTTVFNQPNFIKGSYYTHDHNDSLDLASAPTIRDEPSNKLIQICHKYIAETYLDIFIPGTPHLVVVAGSKDSDESFLICPPPILTSLKQLFCIPLGFCKVRQLLVVNLGLKHEIFINSFSANVSLSYLRINRIFNRH